MSAIKYLLKFFKVVRNNLNVTWIYFGLINWPKIMNFWLISSVDLITNYRAKIICKTYLNLTLNILYFFTYSKVFSSSVFYNHSKSSFLYGQSVLDSGNY